MSQPAISATPLRVLSTLPIEAPAPPNSADGVCRIYLGTPGIFQTPSENLPDAVWHFGVQSACALPNYLGIPDTSNCQAILDSSCRSGLESLWWADDMTAFTTGDKSKWQWTAMIMQPSFVNAEIVADAVADVKKKKNPPAIGKLRFESLTEGTCAQTLHAGPFSEEGRTIEKVHDFIRAQGAKLVGKHHEIYLSDIRKADPAKGKTVIRQPMTGSPEKHHG